MRYTQAALLQYVVSSCNYIQIQIQECLHNGRFDCDTCTANTSIGESIVVCEIVYCVFRIQR
jgi:hypothetical protein